MQAAMTREAVACQTPWISASSSWGRLCLSQDQGQAHAQEQAQHLGPEHRQGARGVGRLTQVQDLAAGDSCATIHDGGLLPEVS